MVLGDDDTYVNIPMLYAALYEEKKITRVRIINHLVFVYHDD